MKYLFAAVLILGLSAAFAACGGAAEDDEEKPSAQEMCEAGCKELAQCFEDSGSPSDDAAECKEDCEFAIRSAQEEGCEDEVDALLSCQDKNLTCEIYTGSGEYPCLRQLRNFSECMDENSGSGS
jgi:hypothetical protein